MKKLIENLNKTHEAYEYASNKLENKIREVCDFNARLTFCAGDGHMVLNEESSNVARLGCLFGKTKSNKLTGKEHEEYCI